MWTFRASVLTRNFCAFHGYLFTCKRGASLQVGFQLRQVEFCRTSFFSSSSPYYLGPCMHCLAYFHFYFYSLFLSNISHARHAV